MLSEKNLKSKLQTFANQCVACGLCLPHCPTYRKTENEADSPRGRIAMMKGVLEQRIPANARFKQHIDLCLTCQACERVCPSKVKYGELIDGVRAFIQEKTSPSSLKEKVVHYVIKTPPAFKLLVQCLASYQKSGLASLFKKTKLLSLLHLTEYDAILPPIDQIPTWNTVYPASQPKGHVALFLGCVTRYFDIKTLQDSIFILNVLGYSVQIPAEQGCCGAFFQHQGYLTESTGLQQLNEAAFQVKLDQEKPDALLFTASGCGTTLIQQSFAYPVRDISEFILEKLIETPLIFKKTLPSLTIFVHDPCTMKNVLKKENIIYQLLERLPNVRIMPLPENYQCCGFGGNYYFSQPEMSQSLRQDKENILNKIEKIDILVTTNIGCALQLQRALHETKHFSVSVLHPVSVLARFL